MARSSRSRAASAPIRSAVKSNTVSTARSRTPPIVPVWAPRSAARSSRRVYSTLSARGASWGQLFAAGVGGAGPDEAAEVVDRGQGEVDRGGLGPPLADEVGAVVPDGVVPGGPVGERVALPAAGWSNSASQDR